MGNYLQDKPVKQQRRPIRLKGYDYRQAGAYFVTIVTQRRGYFFGDVADGNVRLNEAGQMVQYYGTIIASISER